MKVLVLNAGSSSVKFTLFNMENEQVLAKGMVERVGSSSPNLVYKRPDGLKFESPIAKCDHAGAIKAICEKLTNPEIGVIKSLNEIVANGHRVLMGGDKITRPVMVDEYVKSVIREFIPLGPLHNPANLAGIEACESAMPGKANVAVFDTDFHQTMPPEAYLYPIPYEFYEKYRLRKYGFHGTSHKYVTLATAEFLGKPKEQLNVITCHLGNGCSMAAVKNGKVIDTTMGVTPLEGLMMGSRCGDIDAAAVLYLVDQGYSTKEMDTILNKKSGLLAIGDINSGDMRDLLKAEAEGNERASLALKMFVRRVVKYIGSYYVLLGGADAIVFCGGVGEFSLPVRARIVEQLEVLGVKLDYALNEACFGKAGVISTADSKFKAIVMPTDEELMIARSAVKTLKLK